MTGQPPAPTWTAREPIPRLDASSVIDWRGLLPCMAYLLLEFARPVYWFPVLGSLRPGMLVAGWAFATVLLTGSRPVPRPLKLIFAFVALMAWHVVAALNNFWAFEGFRNFGIILLGCLLPIGVLPRNLAAVRALMTAYVLFHVPLALFGIQSGGRGYGSWIADENDLALALIAALGVAIYLLMETRSAARKMWLAAAMALMVTCVVLTMSRGGFVGLAGLGLYLVVAGVHRKTIIGVTIVAVLTLLVFAPATYWEEMGTIRTAHQGSDTGNKRLYYWGMAWRMYLDHPVAGVGTLNYGIRSPEYEDRERFHRSTWMRVAHSMYMTLLAEHGTIGVLIFGMIVWWSFRTSRRISREARDDPDDEAKRTAQLLAAGLLAGIVAVLLTGAFLSVLYYPVIWILVAMLGSLDATRPAKLEAASGGQRN